MAKRDRAERLRADTERLRQNREREERERSERETRENNSTNLDDVQRSAEQLEHDRDELELAEEEEANWEERNHEYRHLAGDAIAAHVMWSVSLMFGFFIDLLLLASVGPQLSRTAKATFGAGDWVVPVGTVVLSVAFIGLELCTGFDFEGKRREWKHGAFAALVGLAMPLTVIGFSLLNSGLLSSDPTKTFGPATRTATIFTTVFLGIVALAAHGFVLMFGRRIMKGIGYIVYKINQIRRRRRINGLERAVAAGPGNVETGFRNAYVGFQNSQTRNGNGDGPTVVPFGARTRRVVNEVFDDEVIEDPKGRGQKTTPDEPPADGPRPTANRSAEYDTQNNTKNEDTSDSDPGVPGDGYDMDGEDEIRP